MAEIVKPVVVTYRLTDTDEGGLCILRDGVSSLPLPSLAYIFTCLAHDLATKLVTRGQRRLIFHAAGLAREGRGIILCGASGSGKSTLAAWLTASGFDFLSDEVVAVTLDGLDSGSPQVSRDAQGPRVMHGLTGPIVLKRGSTFVWQHWLGEDAVQDLVYFLNDTAWVDPESLRPHSVCVGTYPRLLIFPRYRADQSFRARRLSPAEATFRLMHHLINFESLPEQGFTETTRFVQRLPAYSVTYKNVADVDVWLKGIISPADGASGSFDKAV